jgi:hypothetical protein
VEVASFSFGKWYARFIWATLAFGILLVLVIGTSGVAQIVLAPRLGPTWQGLLVAAITIWGILTVLQCIRYRHFLYSRYTVETSGVRIESKSRSRFLPWSSFDVAEYLPAYSMIRLTSTAEAQPIILVLSRGGFEPGNAEGRNALARRLIESGIGRPLTKRWLW